MHKIRWYVHTPHGKIPHQSSMRGTWGYDAECSCGWQSRTGGGTRRYVESLVASHKREHRS